MVQITYLQGRNRDTDVENRCVDMVESGMNWETRIYIYTLLCVKYIANRNLLCSTGSSARCSVVTWGWVGGMGESSERERVHVYTRLIHFVV